MKSNKIIFTAATLILFAAIAVFLSTKEIRKQEAENKQILQQKQAANQNNNQENQEENEDYWAEAKWKDSEVIQYNSDTYEGWQTYRNEKHGFEVKYPTEWEFKENREGIKIGEENMPPKKVIMVSFGTPESYQGGHIWGIDFYNKPNEIEDLIAQVGNQFSDRNETRKKIIFNGINAVWVEVTTNECCDDKDWVSRRVNFVKDNILFGIGDSSNDGKYYASFKFVD